MVGFMIYILLPVVLGFLIFNNSHIEEVGVDYNKLIDLLKPYTRYNLQLQLIKGADSYSVMFDKGMDHICVIRIDRAKDVINSLGLLKVKKETGTGDDINCSLKWYYDETKTSGYYSYHLDRYNYFVVDEMTMTVWYVQFSHNEL